jgi:hypothetical protein
MTYGFWTLSQSQMSSNMRELSAIREALLAIEPSLPGSQVTIKVETDNMAAACYINSQGGRTPQLNEVATQIWNWALEHQVVLTADYRPGVDNQLADSLSRLGSETRPTWSLKWAVFLQLDKLWGTHSVDLFASANNAKLPTYYAWRQEPLCSGVDALSLPWGNLKGLYAFPPPPLIGRVLSKIRREQVTVTLITPFWTTAHWFPVAQMMSIATPVTWWKGVLAPPDLKVPHQFIAWRVSGARRKGSQGALFNYCRPLWHPQQASTTTLPGRNGRVGVKPIRWMLSNQNRLTWPTGWQNFIW